MSIETRVDSLIEAGWYVLETDFDASAFLNWRRQALDCITALVGAEHAYTEFFRQHVEEAEKASLLVGEGILSAAKECSALKAVIPARSDQTASPIEGEETEPDTGGDIGKGFRESLRMMSADPTQARV